MDSKNLEKMLDVIESLEPTSPRPSRIDESLEKATRKYSTADIERVSSTTKFNSKSSFQLTQVPLTIRRGSMDTRKSLFQNEISQPRSNIRRTTVLRANSPSLSKVSQEIDTVEIYLEDFNSKNLIRWDDGKNEYEKVSLRNIVTETENSSTDVEHNPNNNRNTLTSQNIDCPTSKEINHRTSLEITNTKDLRHSNMSENACLSGSAEEREETSKLQSAPQSARNSALDPQLNSLGNQCSLDSGVDQTVSADLQYYLSNEVTNSLESFSDISESNVNSLMEKEFFYLNSESPIAENWLSKSQKQTIEPDVTLKGNACSQQKKQTIKSEEEQNRFFRTISNEMSLSSMATKEIIKFFMRNGTFSSQIVDKFQTAITVCNTLKKKFVIREEISCQIIEVISKESLERPLEDHENILDIFYSWNDDIYTNKFIFQENPFMYKIFKQPTAFTNEMKCDFEITDMLWVKGTNSKWMRVSCFITDGSIYFTGKPGSKDQTDLSSLVNLRKVDFYTCSNSKRIKKEYKSPTSDLIVFKENKSEHKSQENAYIAVQNMQQRDRWLEALKVAKFSFNQLKNNFLECQTCFPSGIRSQSSSQVRMEELSQHFEPCSI